jgi:hypothetical protein
MNIEEIDFQFGYINSSEISDTELIRQLALVNIIKGKDTCSFREIFEDSCIQKIKKALKNVDFFLKDIKINSLKIEIDLRESLNYIAAYNHAGADISNGNFTFVLSRDVFFNYLNPAYKLPLNCRYLWEHELMHLIDHNNIITRAFTPVSGIGSFWINFLFMYRTEGVAELYAFLNGVKKLKNRDEAMKAFRTELASLNGISWHAAHGEQLYMNMIFRTNSFYDIGPWMVLHTLTCSCEHNSNWIDSTLDEVNTYGKASRLMTFWIIRKALKLGNEQFIKELFNPGQDGQSFLTPQIRNDLNLKLKLANIVRPGFPIS